MFRVVKNSEYEKRCKKNKIDRWKYKWNKWLFHTLSSSVCCFTVSRSVPTGDIDASLMPAMSTQSNIAWKSQYETKYECREIVSCLKVSISKISECILLQRTILLCSLKKKKQISLTEYTFLTMQKFKYRLTSVLH